MIEQAAETAKTNVIFNRLFSKVLSEEDLSDYDLTWFISLIEFLILALKVLSWFN